MKYNLSWIFIFKLFCGASKGEKQRRSVKKKLNLICSLRPGLGQEGLTALKHETKMNRDNKSTSWNVELNLEA